jgi:hypothetical protein
MKIHFIDNISSIFPALECKIHLVAPLPLSQKLIKFIQAKVTAKYNRFVK